MPLAQDRILHGILANCRRGAAPMRYLSLDNVPRILAFSGWGNWEKQLWEL